MTTNEVFRTLSQTGETNTTLPSNSTSRQVSRRSQKTAEKHAPPQAQMTTGEHEEQLFEMSNSSFPNILRLQI